MSIAFTEAHIYLPDQRIREGGVVVTEAGRIARVGGPDISVPADAEVIPLNGRFLLPGMIDAHVHLTLDGSPDPMTNYLKESTADTTVKAARFAEKTLSAGITAVRDLGAKDGIDIALRNAVAADLIPGPRMRVSGRVITMTGGHGWQLGREADGPDDTRRAAREQIRAGADIVKLMATGGIMTPGVEPGSEQLTEDELRAAIQEAHKANRKTATHAQGTQGILNALKAGIDSIEHGIYLNDEAIRLMAERNIPLCPTLSALYNILRHGTGAGIPEFAVEKTLRTKPHHLNSIKKARDAGVRIAFATDAGTPFNCHGENLDELSLLVENGFTPAEALVAATRTAAEVMGMEAEIGAVAEGRLADLIVVEKNPLEDIAHLTAPGAVKLVMKGGCVHRRDPDIR